MSTRAKRIITTPLDFGLRSLLRFKVIYGSIKYHYLLLRFLTKLHLSSYVDSRTRRLVIDFGNSLRLALSLVRNRRIHVLKPGSTALLAAV